MALPFDYSLKVVSTNRAVFDVLAAGSSIMVPVNSGGGAGSVTIQVPLEIPRLATADLPKLIEFVNLIVLNVGGSVFGVDWSITNFVLDEDGYLYFDILNHTVGAQGQEGEYLVTVDRIPQVGR